jgi:hypothetical protein
MTPRLLQEQLGRRSVGPQRTLGQCRRERHPCGEELREQEPLRSLAGRLVDLTFTSGEVGIDIAQDRGRLNGGDTHDGSPSGGAHEATSAATVVKAGRGLVSTLSWNTSGRL